jgi:hypothetical protein
MSKRARKDTLYNPYVSDMALVQDEESSEEEDEECGEFAEHGDLTLMY